MFGVFITMLLMWLVFKVFRLAMSATKRFARVTGVVMGVVASVLALAGIALSWAMLMLVAALVAAAALLVLRLLL